MPGFSSFFDARSVVTSCEMYKTVAGATFFAHRSICATRQKRRKIVFRSFEPSVELAHAFEKGSGTAPNAVWTALGCQLAVQNGQNGGQDGQLGGQDGPTCAPKPFRARPGATSQRRRSLKTRQDGSDVDFRGFSGRFFVDFRSLLARFSSYFRSTVLTRRRRKYPPPVRPPHSPDRPKR